MLFFHDPPQVTVRYRCKNRSSCLSLVHEKYISFSEGFIGILPDRGGLGDDLFLHTKLVSESLTRLIDTQALSLSKTEEQGAYQSFTTILIPRTGTFQGKKFDSECPS